MSLAAMPQELGSLFPWSCRVLAWAGEPTPFEVSWSTLVLAVLVATSLAMIIRRRCARKQSPSKAPRPPPVPLVRSGDAAADSRGQYSLVPRDRVGSVPVFKADATSIQWLDMMATRVYEVSHGIFYGEEGGERLPSWQPGEFSAALKRLRQEVAGRQWPDAGILHEPLDDVALCARLIASGLEVQGAAQLVDAYAAYRSTTRGGVFPPSEWLRCGITFVPFEDRLGRPVIVIRPRYHVPGNIDLFRAGLRTTLDAVKAHFLANRSDGFSQTNPLEQYAMVWDFEGAGRKNLDWQAFHCTLEEGARHYPNMGSQIYVLNVSTPFRWVWGAASRLMHPRIRRKCLLISPADVPACMRRLARPELLPPAYGGTGRPWPGPMEATTLEDQVGELVANVWRRQGVVPAGAKPSRTEVDEHTAEQEAASRRLRSYDANPGGDRGSGTGCLGCCLLRTCCIM